MSYNSVFLTLWKTLYPTKEFNLNKGSCVHTLCNSVYLLDSISGHFSYRFYMVYNGIYSDEIFSEVRSEVKYRPFSESHFKDEVNSGIKKLKRIIDQRDEKYSVEDWVAALAVAHYFKWNICPSSYDEEQIQREIMGWRWSFSESCALSALEVGDILPRL